MYFEDKMHWYSKYPFVDDLDLILEYSNHPDIDENVAVIVCGRHTKFLRHYSNQYQDIKRCLGIFFPLWGSVL